MTLVAAWVWASYLSTALDRGNSWTGLLGLALGISAALALLLFLAWFAASLPVLYMRSPEYEQVCATTLTEAQWVEAYVGTIIHRSRALIWLTVCLMPLVTLFLPMPWPLVPVATLPRMTADTVLRLLHFTVVWEVAVVGLYYWVIALAVSLALWRRVTVLAAMVALLAPLGWWWPTATWCQDVTRGLPAGLQLPWELAWTAVLALVPYAAARAFSNLGRRWVRRVQR